MIVTGCAPNAMVQIARTSSPLPVPAPLKLGADTASPGARNRLGRQTAVRTATKAALSSIPGDIFRSTTGTGQSATLTLLASANAKVRKRPRKRSRAASASALLGVAARPRPACARTRAGSTDRNPGQGVLNRLRQATARMRSL